MVRLADVRFFLENEPACALVEVTEAKGSTPRERGAWMLVAADRTLGTIGGGQLEFLAIDRAREALSDAFGELGSLPPLDGEGAERSEAGGVPHSISTPPALHATSPIEGEERGARHALLSIPLGPEIGQCCGGRVELSIRLMDASMRQDFLDRISAEDAARPTVLLFGGGHVGHALAAACSLLPLHVIVVETREDALADMPAGVEKRLTPVPEQSVRSAPAGSAIVVLTHDHALDFLIVAEALARDDLGYVGMIGSKTKRATFRSWYLREAGGTAERAERLVSPIGGSKVGDKRPEIIAALATAEITEALFGGRSE